MSVLRGPDVSSKDEYISAEGPFSLSHLPGLPPPWEVSKLGSC